MTGAEFKQLRSRYGWSLAQCAKYLGVGQRTVARWQNAETVPEPVAKLFKLMKEQTTE